MDPLVIEAGERDAEEIVATLESGRRVVVHTEFLDSEHEVTLRYDDGTFYCDTPTRLHRHEERSEMLECVTKQGYAAE
ncbi:hypothetical protein [Halomicrobium salinisoli]|uniref:hypothetical protein n=1 Tax=Halomicrobium salinisoli TaxID=2878391 RepID=UPI001CEFCEC3|nr:hypothetical protein [Halomicrobium salinisoli]